MPRNSRHTAVDPVFRARYSREIWSSIFNTVLVVCEKTDSQRDILLKSDSLINTETHFLSTLTDVQRKMYRRRGRRISLAQSRNVYS